MTERCLWGKLYWTIRERVVKIHIPLLILLLAGCSIRSPYDRSYISTGIHERADYQLGQIAEPDQFNLPEGILLEDGLSANEAVAISLWNNAHFHADLTALGFARVDLIEAEIMTNPLPARIKTKNAILRRGNEPA